MGIGARALARSEWMGGRKMMRNVHTHPHTQTHTHTLTHTGERGYVKPAGHQDSASGDRLAWPDGHATNPATVLHVIFDMCVLCLCLCLCVCVCVSVCSVCVCTYIPIAKCIHVCSTCMYMLCMCTMYVYAVYARPHALPTRARSLSTRRA